MAHIVTRRFDEFKTFINNGIGVDMIQHAGQDALEHLSDTLYVFYPDRTKYQITEKADTIRDIYRYVFHQVVTV
jgi:phosphate uptake regulator